MGASPQQQTANQMAAMIQDIQKAQAARSAQAQAAMQAEFAEISHEQFLQHMQAMQQHYKIEPGKPAGPVAHYTLPLHLLHPQMYTLSIEPGKSKTAAAVAVPPGVKTVKLTVEGNKAVDDALLLSHNETVAFVNAHAAGIVAAAQTLTKSNDTQSFIRQMNALRDKSKADHNARIDALYNRLIDLGKQHAAQRPRILETTNHCGGFFTTIMVEVEEITQKISAGVAGAAHAVAAAAQSAVQAAGHWASGAVQSVGNFFKGLF